MISDIAVRALKIVPGADQGGIYPAEFAQEMWPDSPGYQHYHKCGPYSSVRGGMMAKVGGGYLGKLHKRGLTVRTIEGRHYLTTEGQRALSDWEEAHATT